MERMTVDSKRVPIAPIALTGAAIAVFIALSVFLPQSSMAGRALRVKPIPAQVDINQLEPCMRFGEQSPQCLEALSNLSPAAGPRQYEVHEVQLGQDNNSQSGDGSSGGAGSGGGSSGGSSGSSGSSGGSSSGTGSGTSSGGSSGTTSGSSSGGASSGSTSSGSSGEVGNGKHPNAGRGNGSELDAHGNDRDPGHSAEHNQGGD